MFEPSSRYALLKVKTLVVYTGTEAGPDGENARASATLNAVLCRRLTQARRCSNISLRKANGWTTSPQNT